MRVCRRNGRPTRGGTAGSAERLSIDCLMGDLVPVADETLAEARQRVARIFEPLAVQIAWFDAASAVSR